MQTPTDSLRDLLSPVDAVFFDFDGPICDVFRGLPAPQVASELADIIALYAPALASRARSTDDPMEVHRLSQEGGESLLRVVEAALTSAEVRAVATAGAPVDGAVQALHAARDSKRRVAVVSNNSADCVRKFLAIHDVLSLVDDIVGRPALRPDLMKPSAHPLLVAAAALGAAPESAVLIGDSTTDVEAARAAGTRIIGYANKPQKETTLAGADVVVLDMRVIAEGLTAITASACTTSAPHAADNPGKRR
ncbi:HAD family hydrolase [Streptomyces sp. RerS4]|uniref:HAD family hydrolase n=1 Tax=Streptomyces sp. RerS4 TaxID=2942449 RepID=UPI00201C7624|nr:HAD family hydrolase [Streptomyces sp. RerS4]UQX00998.1 HAD hydrolase-like protein [Streptomyces sp. RerS4]